MYVKQHGGTLGGLPVKVIYEDSETKPELDVTKTKKLIEQDKVDLLASAMLAFEGLAVVDTIAKAKIALVGLTGVTADEYRKIRSPYLSAAAKHTPSQETFPLGTWAAKDRHYKTAAMVCQDYTWGWETGSETGSCRRRRPASPAMSSPPWCGTWSARTFARTGPRHSPESSPSRPNLSLSRTLW